MAFATPEQLEAYSRGAILATDPRSEIILDGATAAIQRYAGWHIAPALDLELTLDGGQDVIYLPTLKLNSVESITVDGTLLDPTAYEWSRVTGNIRYVSRETCHDSWGGTVVEFNSGYETIPADLTQIVLQVSSQALSSPTGATREQAGQISMQWATTAPGVAGGLSLLNRDLAIVNSYKIAKE